MARSKKKAPSKAKKARKPAARKAKAAPKRAKAARRAKPARKPAKRPQKKKNVSSAVALPALPEIEGYVRGLPPPVKVIVNTLRRIVRESAPEATERMVGNAPAWDANGLFARIETRDRAVLLEFLKGDLLDAPEGVLEEGPGTERHVTLSSVDEVRENVLRTLVRQAVLHNLDRQQARPDAPMMPLPDGDALA